MARVWAVSTNKGGVLKTSLTTNMAGVLSKKHRVLIVDTDNQGNCMLTFGKNPRELETTLYNVLAEGEAVENAIINVHENIDILPSNKDMSFLEFSMMSHPENFPKPFQLLKNAVEPLKGKYDFILVDTPPNMGLIQGNVLSFVDEVLIPFQPESYSQQSILEMIDAIDDFKKQHNPRLSIMGIIGTLVDYRTTLHSEVMQECRKYCYENNLNLFKTYIPRTIRFASSVAYSRLPATLADPKHPVVQKYFELMQEVEQHEQVNA